MRTRSMLLCLLPVSLLLLAGSGCANQAPPATACTLIGCEDGLAVEITGDREGTLQIRVEAQNQAARTFECTATSVRCRTFLPDFTASELTVIVIDADGQETARTFTPDYETTYPNGPDCPPGCEQATVTMAV